MKVYYDEGEKMQSFGVAGEFKLGEPREIADDLANVLIKKGRLKKYEERPATALKAVSAKKEG